MKVHWTANAQEHLEAIRAYIAQNSPAYAMRVVDRLTRRSQQIATFPLSGRKVPEYHLDQIGKFPKALIGSSTTSSRARSTCSR